MAYPHRLLALPWSMAFLAVGTTGWTPQPARAQMGRAPSRTGAFMEAQQCALCHSGSPNARAMVDANGNDVSPFLTWSATTMANSFRDPYWRAQMSREIEKAPASKAEVEGLCLRCHAPAPAHQADLDGRKLPPFEALDGDSLARDGVSCTVCHQARPETLGKPESFSGRLEIRNDQRIYGPFKDPATMPMQMHTGYTPTLGDHVSSSALCGACHTLYTQAPGAKAPFLEQAPYLEWRNSVFSDEGGRSERTRSCQHCHMPDAGAMRIARNPMGLDFVMAPRATVRTHAFVGGNAFMLDLLRANAEELGVTATAEALQRAAAATRAQLAHQTASIAITNLRRIASGIEFDVEIANLTGHKLPSGYPSRRAWVQVDVRAGRDTLFTSGAVDEKGSLRGVADELREPHRDRVESASQVAIYEMVALDASGKVTTSLASMVAHGKDSRLLPKGWRADGPHAIETRPVGTAGDADFTDGRDVVTYALALPEGRQGGLTVIARLQYQAVPPAWANALRASATPASRSFLRMYDAAAKTPETLAWTVATVDPIK
ncbi:MAG: cytochrome c family protein [Vicinamibacteria bacterium]|nr:cytochrome c family protein [Vicinamibacteria bacterium]